MDFASCIRVGVSVAVRIGVRVALRGASSAVRSNLALCVAANLDAPVAVRAGAKRCSRNTEGRWLSATDLLHGDQSTDRKERPQQSRHCFTLSNGAFRGNRLHDMRLALSSTDEHLL